MGGRGVIKKYRIRINGEEYRVEVEGMGGVVSEGKKTNTKEEDPTKKPKTVSTEEKHLLAPMPAKVIKVNCKAGERVEKGDLLITIEAMKMENEILSPREGVIGEIRVSEGASVSHEEVLLVFE